jgi:butyrate kinase
MYQILVINPGSTSTKIAVFQDHKQLFSKTLQHSASSLLEFSTIAAQHSFRLHAILQTLEKEHFDLSLIDACVGRGGLLKPIPSGTYVVDSLMLKDLQIGIQGEHASNLGGILALELAKTTHKPAFIVDPVVVDELQDVARLSGHPQFARKSIFHALNHKAVARVACEQLDKPYQQARLIVAHMGGGISVASHLEGQVVDVNNALDGEGPFSPERSGTLPAGDLVRLCYENPDKSAVLNMIKGKGGLVAYLGTNEFKLVGERIRTGDSKTELVYRAMAYQVSKEIAAQGAVLEGVVDATVISGGMAFDNDFVDLIRQRVQYLAPVIVIPGEREMEALALGALRVLKGEESAKDYATMAGDHARII